MGKSFSTSCRMLGSARGWKSQYSYGNIFDRSLHTPWNCIVPNVSSSEYATSSQEISVPLSAVGGFEGADSSIPLSSDSASPGWMIWRYFPSMPWAQDNVRTHTYYIAVCWSLTNKPVPSLCTRDLQSWNIPEGVKARILSQVQSCLTYLLAVHKGHA